MLAEERLEQFADQVQTRILEGKQARVSGSHAGNQQDKYDSFLHTHEETFQAFLEHSGGTGTRLCLEQDLCCNLYRPLFCRSG